MSHLTAGREHLYATVSFIDPTKDMQAEGTLSYIFILFEKVKKNKGQEDAVNIFLNMGI